VNPRDLHSDPDLLLLEEADEALRDDLERDRRHGPVAGEDFPDIEAELISPELRRRYVETGAFS